jgi:hypothetical protein
MKIGNVVAKLVERRYNCSARSVYSGAPWVSHTTRPAVTHEELCLPGTCGLQCDGCLVGQPAARDKNGTEIRRIFASSPAELDVVCGAQVPAKEAVQMTANVLMAGVDRIRFVSDPALYRDTEVLERLVEFGLWHVTTFVRSPGRKDSARAAPAGCPRPAENDVDLEDTLRCLANLGRTFRLKGHGSVSLCVEAVALPGRLGPAEYLDLIQQIADQHVRLITVPQELSGWGEPWTAVLMEAFDRGLDAGWWLKMPREILEKSLGTMAQKDEVCDHIEALGLVSHMPNQPPCHRSQPSAC